MGDEVQAGVLGREQRQRYREKVQLCLDVFERMLSTWTFDSQNPLTGLEIELNLVDADYQPTMINTQVLEAIADPAYQTELGAYNIEFNVPPRPLAGDSVAELETELRASLNAAEQRAHRQDAHIVMIGILPTLMPEHFERDWMSPQTRYAALNDSIFAARGEDIHLDIDGPERLSVYAATHRPRVRLHQRAAAPAGRPVRVRRQLERRPGAGRPAARARRQLAVLLRPRAVAPRPASSCSSRPPTPGPTS